MSLDTEAGREPGVRPAMQARSRATRKRILKVLARALDDQTIDKLTVADIAKQAKSSVGAFYGRFEDKAAALDALYADRMESLILSLTDANDEARRHRDVHRWIGQMAGACLTHAITNRTLLVRIAGRTGDLAAPPDSFQTHLAQTISALRIKPPHFAPVAADFMLRLVLGLSRDAALFQPELQDDETARKAFAADVQKAALWYLTAPSA
ncbi:TetR/AcrR family transcriptional regulator [Hyphobacterium sp.]|uniref:TetR/AcrR family transcriptional regulator n=1 Tax=Hyphobacterium sp. TaxID=2004662 RepID=UPI003BA84DE9